MARVYPITRDDFLKAVRRYARPHTHDLHVYSDGSKTVFVLLPIVTSKHRHYIEYATPSEKEANELLEKLKAMGFDPINAIVVKAEA